MTPEQIATYWRLPDSQRAQYIKDQLPDKGAGYDAYGALPRDQQVAQLREDTYAPTYSPQSPAGAALQPVAQAATEEGVRQLAGQFLSPGAEAAVNAAVPEIGSTSFGGMSLPTLGIPAAAPPVPTLLGSPTMGAMLPAAGYAAGAYVGGQQASGVMDAFKGKDLSFQQQAALSLPTFGASFLYNPAKKMFGSGKDGDQLARDSVRSSLLEKGFIDKDYNLSLLNGTKFDIGKDGGDPQYNVDFARPNAAQAVAWVNPLAALITGGDKKLTSDFAGYLANAAYSDDAKTLRDNISNLYQKYGIAPDQLDEFMDGLAAQGTITPDEAAIHKANVDSLTRLDDYGVIGKQPSAPQPSTPAPPQETDIQVQQKDPGRSAPPPQAPPPPPKNLNQIASMMSMQRQGAR